MWSLDSDSPWKAVPDSINFGLFGPPPPAGSGTPKIGSAMCVRLRVRVRVRVCVCICIYIYSIYSLLDARAGNSRLGNGSCTLALATPIGSRLYPFWLKAVAILVQGSHTPFWLKACKVAMNATAVARGVREVLGTRQGLRRLRDSWTT